MSDDGGYQVLRNAGLELGHGTQLVPEVVLDERNQFCIICDAEVPLRIKLKGKIGKRKSNRLSCSGNVDYDIDLSHQLLPFFFLKEILRCPANKIEEAFTTRGNPREWFGFCKKCLTTVETALHVQQRAKKLEVRLRDLRENVIQTMKYCVEDSQGEAYNKPVVGDFRESIRAFAFQPLEEQETSDGQGVEVKVEAAPDPANDDDYFDDDYYYAVHACEDEDIAGEDIKQTRLESLPNENQKESKRKLNRLCFSKGKGRDLGLEANRSEIPLTDAVVEKRPDELKPKDEMEIDYDRKTTNLERRDPDWKPGKPVLGVDKLKAIRLFGSKKLKRKVKLSKKNVGQSDEASDKKNPGENKKSHLSSIDLLLTKRKKIAGLKLEKLMDSGRQFVDMSELNYPLTDDMIAKIPSKKHYLLRSEYGTLKKSDFKCPKCNLYFRREYYAIAHIQRVHMGKEKPWKCDMCPAQHTAPWRFITHLQHHELGKIHQCRRCEYVGRTEKALRKHTLLMHKKKDSNPQCDICGQSFSDLKRYSAHMRKQHDLEFKTRMTVMCDLCAMPFRNKRNLTFHQVQQHNVEDVDNLFPKCTKCDSKIFINSENLAQHVAKYHDKSKTFCCDQCGEVFYLNKDLKYHISYKHEKAVAAATPCRVCGIMTSKYGHVNKRHPEVEHMSNEELKEYIDRCNEEKKHKCRLCNEAFAFSTLLCHHQREDHKEVMDKFKCEICGKGYSRACSVKRHYEDFHVKRVIGHCQYCQKQFTSKGGLYQHEKNSCGPGKAKVCTLDDSEPKDTTIPGTLGESLEVQLVQVENFGSYSGNNFQTFQ